MKIVCPHCNKSYDIPEERIKKFGAHVSFPCPSCKGKIEIDLKEPAQPAAPGAEPQQHAPSGPHGEQLKKRILRTISDLPPMPQVAEKARKLTADENASFSDLAKIIETDQAIAARVLKLANSSFYGVMGTVTSIQHASVVLGMKTLNELLTLACASSLLGKELKGYGQSSGDLWQHSLAVAAGARELANRKKPDLADDAFSAGLIHDCGKLILDQYITERKQEFMDFMKNGNNSFLDAEKTLLGFDHGTIAAAVCEKWHIPKRLIGAIQYHHKPSAGQTNDLIYIVHAADAIALMSGIGAGMDGMMYEIDERAMESLELDGTQISELMAASAEYVEKTVGTM